jgi:hypothetical protein
MPVSIAPEAMVMMPGTLLLHRTGRLAGAVQDALEVDGQDPVQIGLVGLQDGAAVHDPGDGGEDVQPAVGAYGLADRLGGAGAVGDVEGPGVRAAAGLADQLHGLLRAGLVAVRADHGGPGLGEEPDRGPAYAAGGACDQGGASGAAMR